MIRTALNAAKDRGLKAPHIAVIDDDESVREAMKSLIDVLGYSVDAFASAEAFLDSKRFQITACVITDVQMPGMSGVELQKHLAAGGYRTPIIFVTAYPDESTRAHVIRNGAAGYLSKPLQQESLLDCLDKALNPGVA
jgi:FixJ family two-component response regulator